MEFIKYFAFNSISIAFFNEKTPLAIAIENENIEIVKLLLSNQNIDVNAISIFYLFLNEILK